MRDKNTPKYQHGDGTSGLQSTGRFASRVSFRERESEIRQSSLRRRFCKMRGAQSGCEASCGAYAPFPRHQSSTIIEYLFTIILVGIILFSFTSSADAGTIGERIEQFPQWTNKPKLKLAKGDLKYPEWMAGTWSVESILTEQFAPLAPDIVTPGFEDNQNYLNQAIAFEVRFGTEYDTRPQGFLSRLKSSKASVVADRGFNGQKIAQAYLGDDNVYRVKVDPDNPNQQITFLKGDRKLISKITGRIQETLDENQFIATEMTQQLFRSPERLYLNEVETTSSYQLLDPANVSAEQITAIYLSPQDPDYFAAGDRPVALYHYHLDLTKQ